MSKLQQVSGWHYDDGIADWRTLQTNEALDHLALGLEVMTI